MSKVFITHSASCRNEKFLRRHDTRNCSIVSRLMSALCDFRRWRVAAGKEFVLQRIESKLCLPNILSCVCNADAMCAEDIGNVLYFGVRLAGFKISNCHNFLRTETDIAAQNANKLHEALFMSGH